jgi:light-regulated signal transduction histidine kinase (bacteriophytochrome)
MKQRNVNELEANGETAGSGQRNPRVSEARGVAAGLVTGNKEGTAGLQEQVAALEAELALYREALRKSREDMQAFAYSVSHDLKAPLRAIEGFSKILLEDFAKELSPDAQRFLQHIVANSETLNGQIEDLLKFCRVGKNPPRIQPVDLDAVCREIISTLPPSETDRVKILARLPSVNGDPVLLREVLAQLIANGLKFSKAAANKNVEISGTVEKEATRISVRDHGIGFDPKHADKLFQVFQKLHSGSEFPGNGIGLAIVKRIIIAHGGCVESDGVPQQGATFSFTLPANTVPVAS